MGNLSGALQQLRAERKQAQGTPYAQSRYVAPRLVRLLSHISGGSTPRRRVRIARRPGFAIANFGEGCNVRLRLGSLLDGLLLSWLWLRIHFSDTDDSDGHVVLPVFGFCDLSVRRIQPA